MAEILELTEKFEQLRGGAVEYETVAIHSEVPDDEQATAFEDFGGRVVKVVLATNAAESSITLPDVDTVICLVGPISHASITPLHPLTCASATGGGDSNPIPP